MVVFFAFCFFGVSVPPVFFGASVPPRSPSFAFCFFASSLVSFGVSVPLACQPLAFQFLLFFWCFSSSALPGFCFLFFASSLVSFGVSLPLACQPLAFQFPLFFRFLAFGSPLCSWFPLRSCSHCISVPPSCSKVLCVPVTFVLPFLCVPVPPHLRFSFCVSSLAHRACVFTPKRNHHFRSSQPTPRAARPLTFGAVCVRL